MAWLASLSMSFMAMISRVKLPPALSLLLAPAVARQGVQHDEGDRGGEQQHPDQAADHDVTRVYGCRFAHHHRAGVWIDGATPPRTVTRPFALVISGPNPNVRPSLA